MRNAYVVAYVQPNVDCSCQKVRWRVNLLILSVEVHISTKIVGMEGLGGVQPPVNSNPG